MHCSFCSAGCSCRSNCCRQLIQQIAQYLPFQLRIYFPIQLILGKLPPDVIARDFALQVVWFLIGLALFQLVWTQGGEALFGCWRVVCSLLLPCKGKSRHTLLSHCRVVFRTG